MTSAVAITPEISPIFKLQKTIISATHTEYSCLGSNYLRFDLNYGECDAYELLEWRQSPHETSFFQTQFS